MKYYQKPGVYIAGVSQLKVEKASELSIRQMGASVIKAAMKDAGIEKVDAIFLGNMLSGVISHQEQLAPLVANEAGLKGTEAINIEAACGSGGAALRMGFMAIMSGMCDTVVVCGVEKMSHGDKDFITKSIATASDWEKEGGKGETFVTLNARLMQMYIDKYDVLPDNFAMFGVNAHKNANINPNAMFKKEISVADYINSKFLTSPVRLYDASPICDGAAAIVLSKYPSVNKNAPNVKITASASSTEYIAISDRCNPLELHDAYSIISTLSLEAMGFAKPGEGWKLAFEGEITPNGKIPVSTFGGLKGRGHPIGASGVYQAVEAYLQLTGKAGANQIKKEVNVGLTQSVGGTASTVFTHVLVKEA